MAHHTYTSETIWQRGNQLFTDKRYSRSHLLRFDGGTEVAGSSSPHSVPPPYSVEAAIDPEEALVSAVSSCHMLWFLGIAAQRGHVIDSYHDQAEGVMTPNERGRLAISKVTLRPLIVFSGSSLPTHEEIDAMHHEAHESCNIANSIRGEVVIEAPR